MSQAIELSLFASRVAAACEEMGAALGRAAFSPNIRDRLDYSCALFDARGRLLGQATHIPVHLGSMAHAMQDLVAARDWDDGDELVVNDPFAGGTHLPDVTLVRPVFHEGGLAGFCANRAHHADIGSDAPGSMPVSRCLEEEGMVIPPTLLSEGGEENRAFLEDWYARVARPDIARGDLAAQRTANRTGARRLGALLGMLGHGRFEQLNDALQDYAEQLVVAHLAELGQGTAGFTDLMDGDGLGASDVPIHVNVQLDGGRVTVDFEGTGAQVQGNINCPLAVTAAAVHYVFRCLAPPQAPSCEGAMRPVTIRAPEGCLVNAQPPAAVAAGNVETSQRIVDAVCGALAALVPDRIPAASQGTMNNLAMGARGERGWDYYETLAGGAGGGPSAPGRSGRHTHMTNTLNTPIEVLERHYPLRVERYALRRGSGGDGRFRGGDGVVRALRFLADAEVSLLTERRTHAPWGLAGGEAGQAGRNLLDGQDLPGKCQLSVKHDQVLEIHTPGGGGFGPPRSDDTE
ncbi:MAG: hydantoinase B/oxoprolinase family protein [Xanthomonadales bacterium]|nr:hydantoinase B/oxoprolinase family protein [Xanthomonadales bacterium]